MGAPDDNTPRVDQTELKRTIMRSFRVRFRVEVERIFNLLNVNLSSGPIFVSLFKYNSGGKGETKREPDTKRL